MPLPKRVFWVPSAGLFWIRTLLVLLLQITCDHQLSTFHLPFDVAIACHSTYSSPFCKMLPLPPCLEGTQQSLCEILPQSLLNNIPYLLLCPPLNRLFLASNFTFLGKSILLDFPDHAQTFLMLWLDVLYFQSCKYTCQDGSSSCGLSMHKTYKTPTSSKGFLSSGMQYFLPGLI